MLVVRQAVVGPFAENSYLVACSRTLEALVVDPGGEADRLLALAERGGFRIGRVFLTHGHVDHLAAAAEVKRRTGAPIQIHAGDRELLPLAPAQAEMLGFDEPVEVPPVDRWHEHGEALPLGESEGRILHTPGHSRGSCSLWFEKEGILFSGDTLFAGSVGRTDLPGGDFGELQRSIVERLFPLGDAVHFHPGHGPAGVLGRERHDNPFVGEGARRGRFL